MVLLNLLVTIKQAGKRKAKIVDKNLMVSDDVKILKDLICDIVTSEVKRFNEIGFEEDIFNFLTSSEIEDNASIGKVSFNEKHNKNKQDLNKAIENALQCFEDGIFRVFINEEEKENLNDELNLTDGDKLVFIKFTMLAGRLW